MKRNILIITSSYPAISGESFEGICIEVFAQALASCGNNVTILTQCVRKNYYKDSQNLSVQRFNWSKSVKPLSTLNLLQDSGKIFLYFFNGIYEVEQMVKQGRIDIVICAWAIPSGLFGLYLKKRFGIPYVIWALGSDIWNYSKSYILSHLLRHVLSQALHIYADGDSLIKDIERLTSKKATFLSSSRILPRLQSKPLALKTDRCNFLFVGRYHKNKGPDILIEAIRMLHTRILDRSYFYFFGIGPMRWYLESIINQYNLRNFIELNGPIQTYNLSQYLEAVDFLIIPSRIESIPVIFSDALQKRCPIIATHVGDMGELMAQYHVGYMAQQANPRSLSEALSRAVVGKEQHFDGMEALCQMFNPLLNAQRFMNDLEQLHP